MIVSDKVERLKQAGFTSEEIGLLTKMEQGDTNNKKGHFYEKCFTVFQVLKFTNQKNIENSTVLISNDESSFVDDLQVEYLHNNQKYKDNFQLKNSPTTGKWSESLEEKFNLQKKYNDVLHQDKQNTSYLICSDKDTIESNYGKVTPNCVNQFYPYHPTFLEMLGDDETQLKDFLEEVCPDKTQYDTALRLLSLPINSEKFNISLDKWWEMVKKESKPNIFRLENWSFPDAFKQCCEKYGFTIQVDTISFRGFDYTITDNLVQRIHSEPCENWNRINTPDKLFKKIMELSTIVG